MRRIALIGSGRLGARHLQGLGRLTIPVELHIVDPSEEATTNARERLLEVKPGANIAPLVAHRTVATLPPELDLAIVATTADVRLAVMKALLERCRLGALVLEKVLFQELSEYEQARRLLEAAKTKAWVNCPRRLYSVYQELKQMFAADPLLHVHVWGGQWGLGSNAVHFLDLVAFLSGKSVAPVDASGLAPGTRAGKRAGYVDLVGALRGTAGQCSFNITAEGGVVKHLVTLRGASSTAIVDEEGGTVWKIDSAGSRLSPITIPYQSSLTGEVAQVLLTTGACLLPTYEESMAVHMALLPALARHCGSPERCPVT